MAGVNKVILIGHMGKDPEIRSFQGGGKVASFSIATSESWKDKQTGERKERTEWHRIQVFGDGLVGVIERYTRKGSKIYIEGQLRTRKWQDNSGNDHYATEVNVNGNTGKIVLLDGKGEGGSGNSEGSGGSKKSSSGDNGGWGGQSSGYVDDLDDDIPF